MHVLVTGGAGFIGSHTVEHLVNHGSKVTVLDNLSSGKIENLQELLTKINFIEGDVCEVDSLDKAMRNITHVIHLAAQVSVQKSIENPIFSNEVNIQGFLNVLHCSHMHKITKIVYASSAAVYGSTSKLPITEQSKPLPESPYGLEKLTNDNYAQLYKSLHSTASAGMRYFNVYGPKQDPGSQYSGVISKFLAAALNGTPLNLYGDGTQTRDFVFVGDVARANVAALTSEAKGVFNIGTGSSVTLIELIKIIEDILGQKLDVQELPSRMGDIQKSEMSSSLMRNTLGISKTVSLRSGLLQLIEYIKQR